VLFFSNEHNALFFLGGEGGGGGRGGTALSRQLADTAIHHGYSACSHSPECWKPFIMIGGWGGGVCCVCIFKQSIGARNRVGIGLSYRPARLHSLAGFFLGIDSGTL
jgi:hypothetical protein